METAIRPTLAANPAEATAGPQRALILAGGGMRVAWQAGVLAALEDHGLRFTHADGTSGGIMNLAALLSGVAPRELCERWRTLEPRQFSSFAPLQDYFRPGGPLAMGDARGITDFVFPHLGIDIGHIRRAEGIAGCFNVCNFSRKTVEAITHTEVETGHLVAGMSLPIFSPPVEIDGTTYTDAVWIKDANLIDAVKRGAEELWLIWCIGNTPQYRRGPFDQYVHMIEMAANGGLNEEFDRIREINERILAGEQVYGHTRPIRLHVVRPEYPLPLDPAYFFGEITADDLIALGHTAARRYLARMCEAGVPFEPETMIMITPASPGVTFSEVMKGPFSLDEVEPREGAQRGRDRGHVLAMNATVTVRDVDGFLNNPERRGSLAGSIDFSPWGKGIPAEEGTFKLFAPADDPKTKLMVYELPFEYQGVQYYLAGRKEVRDDPGIDLWKDTTTLFTQLHSGTDARGPVVGAGILTLGIGDFLKVLANLQVIDADSATEKAATLAKFGRFFAGNLWETYVKQR